MVKAKDYLDAGLLRLWVIHSKARSITVFFIQMQHHKLIWEIPYLGTLYFRDRVNCWTSINKARISTKITSS